MEIQIYITVLCTFIFVAHSAYTPPVLTEEPQDAFGFEDKPLTLRCRATGSPPPVYIWKKKTAHGSLQELSYTGGRVKATNEGDLIFEKFNPADDVGQYRCIARVLDSHSISLELKLISRLANVRTKSTEFLSYFKGRNFRGFAVSRFLGF